MGTDQHGRYYWCVKVTTDVSQDGEIYLMADEVVTDGSGALQFWQRSDKEHLNLVIASGRWLACYAASLWDGAAVSVEHWNGEVDRGQGATYDETTPIKERNKMTKSVRYDVLKRDGFKCRICGVNGDQAKLRVDHIIPLSKGGHSEMNNLQTLCHSCNAGKSDKQ